VYLDDEPFDLAGAGGGQLDSTLGAGFGPGHGDLGPGSDLFELGTVLGPEALGGLTSGSGQGGVVVGR
jgi:hypothetical protein